MVLAVVMHAGLLASRSASPRRSRTALVVGAFNGVLIAYLGFPPFVVTLGMLSIARSLAMVASNNTVVFEFGPDHDKLLALGGGAWLFGIANPVLYMVVLALITGFVLRWTQVRPPCLRHRRQRACGDADRRSGASRSRLRST